jgi:hypothetical protein
MASVTVTIKTETDDVTPVPIDSVDVLIYQSDGTTFVTQGITGNPTPGSGEVQFSLFGDVPGVTYVVRLAKAGVSFLPALEFQILVTDPPNPNNNFTFTGHVGQIGIEAKLIALDDELSPNPIEDVRFRVFDSGDAFVTELDSDVAGETTLILEGDPDPGRNYIVRLYKAGVVFETPTQVIQVHEPLVAPNTNEFEFVGHVQTLPESTNPDMCRVTGTLYNVSRQPTKGLAIRALPILTNPDARVAGFPYPSNPTIVNRGVLAVEAKHEAVNGAFDFLLPRGGCFDMHVYGMETPDVVVERVNVPDAPAVALEDILFPYVQTVSYATDPINVAAGDSVEVEVEVRGSDGKRLSSPEDLQGLVEFTISDEDVAEVEVTGENTLTVTGILVGTATIEVARRDNTTAPQRPDLPDIVVTPATINVT